MPRRSPLTSFRRTFGRNPGRTRLYRVPVVKKSDPLPPESMEQYWHPGRFGVEPAPAAFAAKLKAISPDLAACRPPANAPLPHKWLVWYRRPRVKHWLCPGWLLLFVWPPDPHEPLPLDNRVLANLYQISRFRFGSAVEYFDHCVKQKAEAKQKRKDKFDAETRLRRREYLNSMKISNIGRGNKFAMHHDGTLIPSKAQLAWMKETRKQRWPKEMRDEYERETGRKL